MSSRCHAVHTWVDEVSAARSVPPAEILAHVRGCAECRQLIDAEAAVRAIVARVPTHAPDGMADRIVERIAREARPEVLPVRPLWVECATAPPVLAAAALALACLAGGPSLWRWAAQMPLVQSVAGMISTSSSMPGAVVWSLCLSLWLPAIALAWGVASLGTGRPGQAISGIARPSRSC